MKARMKARIPSRMLGMALLYGMVIFLPVATSAQTFRVIYKFKGGADGGNPYASTLVLDSVGTLYGTTQYGGDLTCTGGLSPGCGTIFKLDSGIETVLHSFNDSPDGRSPLPGLVSDGAGNFYGTTSEGGAFGFGTVFKVDMSGHETVLHSFTGTGGDGAAPYAGLVGDTAGHFYGTTSFGGAFGFGTVFKVSISGEETVLYSFRGGLDGATPFAGLILDSAGNLYGTTYWGGSSAGGVVFKLDPVGNETVLHTFGARKDGAHPYAGLALDGEGAFYGTTYFGGKFGFGTIFKIDTASQYKKLHSFSGPEGANPYFGSLVIDNGSLFGAASTGGTSNVGTVFVLKPGGTLKVLHTFSGVDGANPLGGLVRNTRGALYGTTYQGGRFGAGVVFKIVP